MESISLDTRFASELLEELRQVDEVQSIDFGKRERLHTLLCDLVGRLATQLGPRQSRRRPVSLEALFVEKYLGWDGARLGDDRTDADTLLARTLKDCGRSPVYFVPSTPAGTVHSFVRTLENSHAVRGYELSLLAMSDAELDALNLANLADGLAGLSS